MTNSDMSHMPRRNKKEDDPKMIGLWKVGRTIGKGSSGRVRIARHTKTGQYAAVKIVSKNNLLNSRMSLRSLGDEAERILHSIEREIVIMKLIDHPNIMRLYDVWETSTELYLILEYVEGGELFDYLCNKGKLSSSEALGYFQQIITAVHYCHRFNIAHRDLKPENLLLDRSKNIKVADFGMAAWQGKSNMLQTACGSPHYAAPEVIMGRAYNGSSSDIWSCGVILYALLAGRLPFDDEDLPTLLEKVKIGKYSIPADIDPRATDLITKMLQKDVSKRITIPEILDHPFYTSQKPKDMNCDVPNLDHIAQPLTSTSDIDSDIFANLRTLWHGTPDEDIVAKLTNEEHTWEKGVYHLLVRYRAKHLENYDEDEEKLAAKRATKRQSKKSSHEDFSGHEPDSLPPRAGPPTPRRAARTENVPSLGLSQMRQLSFLGSSLGLSPVSSHAQPSSLAASPLVGPSTVSSSAPGATSPLTLQVPEMQDEKIQHFFHQIVEHLNVMQVAGNAYRAQPGQGSLHSPVTIVAPPPTPLAIDPRGSQVKGLRTPQKDREGITTPSDTFGTDISGQSYNTRPLSIRRRSPERSYANSGKENSHCHPRLGVRTAFDDFHSPVRKSSQRSCTPSNERVHILKPPPGQTARLKKRRNLQVSPTSPASALSEGSFVLPSTPKRRWFGNLFKFRPTVYHLLSVEDAHNTREVCRQLLEEMGVSVALAHSPPEDTTGHTSDTLTLKCWFEESRDPRGVMSPLKGVRFRVELHRPNAIHAMAGYAVLLILVLEKGAATSLKLVYNRLRREWNLDAPPTSSPLASRSPMLGDDERFVEVVYAS
ncbi:hypothetical protein AcV5_009234 [Taiwanofungus camphoratus]|nr:hypothetical protein AcV5_009234 [Antrodia cinnamomea]